MRTYVGIKDRNGVDVREGDIYRTHVKYQGEWQVLPRIGTIEYKVFPTTGTAGYSFPSFADGESRIEVVGNIYDDKA